MTSRWVKVSKHGKYTLYKKKEGRTSKTYYNVTTNGRAPNANAGGYYDKRYLFEIKGIK